MPLRPEWLRERRLAADREERTERDCWRHERRLIVGEDLVNVARRNALDALGVPEDLRG